MQPEIHKERVAKYGSFLYCPERSCLCFGIDTPDGTCKKDVCYHDDPKYIAKQAEIDRRVQENALREAEERKKQEAEPMPEKKVDLVKELTTYIARREAMARRAYRENKPKKGDAIMQEVLVLTGKLRKIKGARND